MIAAVHLGVGLVTIPQFPDGGGSLCGHISPGGIAALGSYQPRHIGKTLVAEGCEQPRDANDAARQMSLMTGDDRGNEVLGHLRSHTVGYQTKGQRKDVGGSGIVAVKDAVGIKHMTGNLGGAPVDNEKMSIEMDGHLFMTLAPLLGFGRLVGYRGKTFHQLHHTDEISGGEQTTVGLPLRVFTVDKFQLLGRHTPIAVFVAGDDAVTLVFVGDMVHPTADAGIRLADGLRIAILMIEHVANKGKGSRPGDVIGIIVPEGGCHIGDIAIRALRLTDVAHPFGIEAFIVEKKTLTQRSSCAVAQPGLTLIALRTVNRHALVVAADAPIGVLDYPGEQGIGTGEMARTLHRVAYGIGDNG